MQKATTDTAQDAILEKEIDRISRAIINRYGKFRPVEAAATKRFVFSNANGLARLPLFPYFLRSASAVVFDAHETTTTTLTSSDYQLRPTSPMDGVYRWIRFPAYRTAVGLERTVDVTGDWGFSTTPEDVEEACILAVVERIRRDVSGFTATFPDDEAGTPERPAALPRASRVLLAHYDQAGQG